MKYLLAGVVFVLLAIGAGVLIHQDSGYVYLSYGDISLETTLFVASIAVVLSFIACYFAFRFLGLIARTPQLWRRRRLRQQEQRAITSLSRGMMALIEGDWQKAERLFTREAERSPAPWLHHLFAAQSAQRSNQLSTRDHYLKTALSDEPKAEFAIALVRAELLLGQQQKETALACLKQLLESHPRQTRVLQLAAEVFSLCEDWASLTTILPELRKRQLLGISRVESLEQQAWQGLLASGNAETLQTLWEQLPKAARDDEQLLHVYVSGLLQAGMHRVAEPLLRNRLNRNWSSILAKDYGLVKADDNAKQLDHAEVWLKQHGRDAALLLSLGRICVRRKLWGKARIYFESSLGIDAQAETYQALGDLLEQLQETDTARTTYKAGLNMLLPKHQPLRNNKSPASTQTSKSPRVPAEAAIPAPTNITKLAKPS